MAAKILIVEDDQMILNSLSEALSLKGYNLYRSATLAQANKQLGQNDIDLIILDIQLPDGSGVDFCKQLRFNSKIPIIFLTARNDEKTIVDGLNAGGDDYVCKPFSINELYARIASVLRRVNNDNIIVSGDIKVDKASYQVYKNDEEIILTAIGYQILFLLISSQGRVITREHLLEFIESKTGNFIEDNTLSVHIKRVREKIGVYHGHAYIETIRGIGYRWVNN